MDEKKRYDLIVVGAGPGGISVAAEAQAAGIPKEKILVIDKAEAHSWVIRSLYPDRKLVSSNYKGIKAVCHGILCLPDVTKDEAISYLDWVIQDTGIEVHYREVVLKIDTEGTAEAPLFYVHSSKDVYATKLVVIAIGVFGKPNKPDYKLPSKLRKYIHFDINSFEASGERILIVGGGDSASEFAQFLVEQGNELSLSYRRDSFVRMNAINRQTALGMEDSGRLEILWKSQIASLTVSDSGKPLVHFSEEQYGTREYDRIVYALGGSTPQNFLQSMGIKFTGKQPDIDEYGESRTPGLFVGGDLHAGLRGGSIAKAFNASRSIIERICGKYVDCTPSVRPYEHRLIARRKELNKSL